MFDAIARRYDLANTAMTFGQDQRWRRRAARIAVGGRQGATALDCACGTGRLAVALYRSGALRVVGMDFSPQMIEVARAKHPSIEFVVGDVLRLPFQPAAFDAVTIGFGLRNLPDAHAGLREMTRVLRPGGRLVVLEAVRPEGTLRPLRDLAATLGPRVSGVFAGNRDAYRYLSDTVRSYVGASELAGWLEGAGLTGVRVEPAGFGTVALVWGERAANLLE